MVREGQKGWSGGSVVRKQNVGNDVVKGQASGFAGVGCCSMESGEPSEC